MKMSKLDCYPVLWVQSVPSATPYTVTFKQKVAARFLVLKLIDSIKNSAADNNIDMYNLILHGYTLSIPTQ
jgi:hypothetical protein